MRSERSFTAERPAAQHCAELMRGDAICPAPLDVLPSLARAGEKLARLLSARLAPLLGGAVPTITVAAPVESDFATLARTIPALAANSLLAAGAADAPLLATVDAAAVLRIVDRTFGGRGLAPAPLPDAFPLSAEIMIRRIEGLVATSLAEALGAASVEPVRRNGSLAALEAFADSTPMTALTLTVAEADGDAWPIVIALPATTLALLYGAGKQTPARSAVAAPRSANPTDEPFGDLPLTVTAVIVDTRLTMAALAALRPGAMLPVSVARNVPLRIGDKTIATGTIGAVDDRVAIQITQAF